MFEVQRTIFSSDKNTSKQNVKSDQQKYKPDLSDTICFVEEGSLDNSIGPKITFFKDYLQKVSHISAKRSGTNIILL